MNFLDLNSICENINFNLIKGEYYYFYYVNTNEVVYQKYNNQNYIK